MPPARQTTGCGEVQPWSAAARRAAHADADMPSTASSRAHIEACTGATRRWYAAAAPSDGAAPCTCSSTLTREDTFRDLASNAQVPSKPSHFTDAAAWPTVHERHARTGGIFMCLTTRKDRSVPACRAAPRSTSAHAGPAGLAACLLLPASVGGISATGVQKGIHPSIVLCDRVHSPSPMPQTKSARAPTSSTACSPRRCPRAHLRKDARPARPEHCFPHKCALHDACPQ